MTSVQPRFSPQNYHDENKKKQAEKYDHSKALAVASAPCSIMDGNLINFDAQKVEFEINTQFPAVCVERIESDQWIKKYGLKSNKLTFEAILSMIGFKKQQDYIDQVKKLVASKYSKGLFLQTQSKDGLIYNITVNVSKLVEFAKRLEDSIKMFKLRLKWLNTDSRRLFGVITEQSVCLVIDCKTKDNVRFSQYKSCIIKLLKEQVSRLSNFNIIRCSDKIEYFRDKAVVVSSQTIEDSIEWLYEWNREFVKVSSDTMTSESVMLAYKDKSIEAIYLISQGISSNGVREILHDKAVKLSSNLGIKLNVVSFDCVDSDTVEYLRRLGLNSKGKFHAYCLLKEYEDYTSGPIDPDPTKSRIIMNKRVFGGAPPGSGIKTDLMLVFEEIQLAMETHENIQALIESMNRVQSAKIYHGEIKTYENSKSIKNRDEQYLTSREWLVKHGLSSKNLDLFDVLSKVCFRHCDGVVDIKKETMNGKSFLIGDGITFYQGDAIPSPKLVNAKYCDQFAHVLWNDGTIMHVHVTPDLHRNYEQNITMYLEMYEKRIDWLSKGSRELFGTVIERNICILVDTSQSMHLSLDFVKRKLQVLIQEQLRNKQRFNLIGFNSKIYPWRDRMVEVDEFNIKSALEWINCLSAHGTTNTLAAIRFALSDLNTEAIYLLSDGRPDQEPRQILSQVHLNTKIPIHTISFNCNDSEANKFLSKLAEETNGRYHYFNESGWDADPYGPIPYQSEDISLLKKEIEKGKKYLLQMSILREECAKLSVKQEIKGTKKLNRRCVESQSCNFESKYDSKTSYEKAKIGFNVNNGVLSSLHDINSLEWTLPETRSLLERQFRKQSSFVKENPKHVEKIPSPKKKRSTSNVIIGSKAFKWLQKNSLEKLKLTIFDVLQRESDCTSNLVVDELFNAKIWTEIMETAEHSKINKSKFQLINPSKIDWNSYQSKLDEQIAQYKKYLVEAIWDSLPEHEKIILNLEPPIDYDKNKSYLLNSLEYSNWPVKKSDIESFDLEIEKALNFKRFAQELSFYFMSKSSREDELTIKDNNKFDESAEMSNVNKSLGNLIKKTRCFAKGNRVIVGNNKLAYFFEAKISKVIDSAHYDVKFIDVPMMEKNVLGSNIIRKNDSASYLTVGDFVMAKVINEFEQNCWAPGIIQTIDTISIPKVYDILFFNGQDGQSSRDYLVKINKTVYGYAVNFIRNQIGDKTSLISTTSEPQNEKKKPDEKDNNESQQNMTIIVQEIKNHINSLKLDKQYKKIRNDFTQFKNKHDIFTQKITENYDGIRSELDQLKKSPNNKEEKDGRKKKSKPVVKSTDDLILEYRAQLPELKAGEKVLAKWSDDNWYYQSIVENKIDFKESLKVNFLYTVKDSAFDHEEMYREDIIGFNDSNKNFSIGDFVVAEHPDFVQSFAPGQIVGICSDYLIVKFYDSIEHRVERDSIYKIPSFKYQLDIDSIIDAERQWIGKKCVFRNSRTKLYETGQILSRVGNGKRFKILSDNGDEEMINIIHIFGDFTRKRPIKVDDFVLAPVNDHFFPGKVKTCKENQIEVVFVDEKENDNVEVKDCFWLSKEYYNDFVLFYKSKETEKRTNTIPIVDASGFD